MTTATPRDWYEVSYSIPYIAQSVNTSQDAINIAVSELGKRVAKTSPTIRNADISVQTLDCASCGTETEAVLVVSGSALVGLLLTVEVQARSLDESGRVGLHELGPHLPDTPLKLVQSPKRDEGTSGATPNA